LIRLIVSDVDGTLLSNDSINQWDVIAIQRAAAQGIEICLASGRMYPELKEVSKRLGVPCHCVSQNGSFVHTSAGEMIASASFPVPLARQLLSIAKNGQFLFTVSCSDNQIYVTQKEYVPKLRDRMLMPVNVCLDIERVFEQGILPCKFAFFGELQALEDFRSELKERFSEEINTFISDKDSGCHAWACIKRGWIKSAAASFECEAR
jgi:hydroxymethylpyrimidine pyrophosphatase-like HAD family hydrolase